MSAPDSLAEHSPQLAVRDAITTFRDHIHPFLLIKLVGVVIGAYTPCLSAYSRMTSFATISSRFSKITSQK